MSGPEKLIERTKSSREILCAKCDHVNAHGRTVCEACGAHLLIVCHRCGRRTERARARCAECNQKLHRSVVKRAWRTLFGRDPKISLTQILLLVLGIIIGIALIVNLSELSLPEAER